MNERDVTTSTMRRTFPQITYSICIVRLNLEDFQFPPLASGQSTHCCLSFGKNPAEQEKCETIGHMRIVLHAVDGNPLTQPQIFES
jgi:hypothetical protein